MTLYFRLKVKDLLTNAELLGWSIAFMEFWVFMWFFVFSPEKLEGPWDVYAAKVGASMAFCFLGLLSISAVAVSLAYYIFYASRAARYITKFTRLGPGAFVAEDFAASLMVILVVAGVMYASVVAGAYARWGIVPAVENPLGVIADLVAVGIAVYLLAYALALAVIVARKTRAISMVSFVPLILGFVAYSQLWVDMGWLTYVIPLSSVPALVMYHASGVQPPTGAYLKWLWGVKMPAADLRLAATSLVAWMAAFVAASVVLVRVSRGVAIEEITY